jgi:hypothetical protein
VAFPYGSLVFGFTGPSATRYCPSNAADASVAKRIV